jgi:cyclic 2,3-diphosphoglycerate synthetase
MLQPMRSDLVILLGDVEAEFRHRTIRCALEPEPASPVPEGARVAVFTTARPEHAGDLRAALERQGIEVVLLSTNLARRALLLGDLEQAKHEGCDFLLTELKAAAIDTVAEAAEKEGLPVGWLRNRVESLAGEPELEVELWRLFDELAAPVKT